MVTTQIQKTRTATAQTKSKTTVTQKQSLEVVQTLLHGGLSSLAYLRMFFAEKAFDQQTYSASTRVPSYNDYVSGKLPREREKDGGMQTEMQVLRRARSKRADSFLDWLEKGAFSALKEGRLKALQVYVHADPENREKVVETYTFTIKYHSGGEGSRVFAGLEVDSLGKEGFTVEATSFALQNMLRDVIELCEGLPELPEKRFISMALFFPQDSDNFKAKGFEPSTVEKLLFAQGDGWEKHTRKLREVHSAFHSTSLKVSHLDQPFLHALSSIAEPIRIPSCLEYAGDGTKEAEIADMLEAAPHEASGKSPSTVGRTPSTVFPEDCAPADGDNFIRTPAPTSAVPVRVVEDDTPRDSAPVLLQASSLAGTMFAESLDTQSSDVPKMKTALQDMLMPEHVSQGDTQTQAMLRPPVVARLATTEIRRFATPLAKASASVKLVLLPEVSQRLQASKAKLRQRALKLAGVSMSQARKADVILCQCGHAVEEDDLINCSFCSTWQHLHCYGFTGSEDPRMPGDHACYQCLLGNNDDRLLSSMKEMALKRRAVSFALQHGLQRSKEELAKSMCLPVSVAKTLLAYLVDEGFVTHPTRMRRSGLSGMKKPYFTPVHDGPAYDKLQHDLFDPLTRIAGYYTNISSLSTVVAQQLRALRSGSTPPPATPASRSPKQALHSPGSDLDLRPSLTPFRTPNRLQEPLLKRPLDEDIFSTPAKRQATATPVYLRFKSVQTVDMLNVDGLSSPAL